MKTEEEKMATKLAKTMEMLSAFSPRGQYAAFLLAAKLLEQRGYSSVAQLAEAAANKAYLGE